MTFHGRRKGKMLEAYNDSQSIWGEMTCATSTHILLTKASVMDTGKMTVSEGWARLRGAVGILTKTESAAVGATLFVEGIPLCNAYGL